MVAIDRHDSAPRTQTISGVLRPFVTDFLRPFVFLANIVRRQVTAEKQRIRIRMAEKISTRAGQPASGLVAESVRLNSAAITSRLQPWAIEAETVTVAISTATVDAHITLDRIDYELAAIRAELAPYMPR